MKGVLVIAHGSRASQTEADLEAVLACLEPRLPDTVLQCAFMEFSERSFQHGVAQLVARGVTEIKVVPYFLFLGMHLQKDIPELLAECARTYPDVTLTMGRPLGFDERLADILLDRINECA